MKKKSKKRCHPKSISLRKIKAKHTKTKADLAKSKLDYKSLVENVNSAIIRFNTRGQITFINRFGLHFFGYNKSEILGKSMLETIVPKKDTSGHNLEIMIKDIVEHPEKHINNENENIRKDGERVWVSWTNKPVFNERGRLIEILCIGNDITRRKKMEERLEKVLEEVKNLSLTDELTGLNNRRGFLTLAEQRIKIANRIKEGLSLFYIDMDNLKQINDKYGHLEGDKALVDTSKILKTTFRKADIIGRIGGDEFAVFVLENIYSGSNFFLDRLNNKIDAFNKESGQRYNLSLSIGHSRYDIDKPCSVDELLTEADSDMYKEKHMKHTNKLN